MKERRRSVSDVIADAVADASRRPHRARARRGAPRRGRYGDMCEFFALLPRLLRRPAAGRAGGRFSFFNGLSGDNVFAQALACRSAQADLGALGLDVAFEPCAMSARNGFGDMAAEWRKVDFEYWGLEVRRADYSPPFSIHSPSILHPSAMFHAGNPCASPRF